MAEVEAEEAVAEEVFEVEAEVEEEAVLETGIKIKVPLKLLKVRERYHDEGSPETER